MKAKFTPLVLMLVALSSIAALAQNIYVAQNAAGANSGADCANAHPTAWFNSSANWGGGAAQVKPGTTVHLCGTITSNLDPQGSGTAGNVITILFETGANITQPTFNPPGLCNGGATHGMISLQGLSYITVDGGTNGLMQLTANSSSQNHNDGCAFNVMGASNFTIKNIDIENLYVRTDPNGTGEGGYCVFSNSTITGYNRFTNSKCRKANNCWFAPQGAGTAEIDHIDCSGVSEGAVQYGGSPTHLYIHDNTIHDNLEWLSPTDYYHNDAIHIATFGGSFPDIQIYNNDIYGDWGFNTTGFSYFECDNTPTSCPAKIYNNLYRPSVDNLTNGMIACKDAQNMSIYNNFFSGPGNAIHIENGGAGGCSNVVAENNIFSGVGAAFAIGPTPSSYGTRDYNDYYNANQTAIGLHDITSNPNLDSSYHPQASSPGNGKALNLTGIGITALNSDKSGAARPGGTTAWDIGPYAYNVSSSSNPPTPPSGLIALTH